MVMKLPTKVWFPYVASIGDQVFCTVSDNLHVTMLGFPHGQQFIVPYII